MLFLPRHVVSRHRRRALLSRRLWSKGAISWGSDLSGLAPTVLNSNADVVAAAGAWSTVLSSQSGGTGVPVIQRTNNDFYPYIAGVLDILLGVAAPTALMVSYALVAGTPIATYTVPPGLLVNSAEILVPIFLVGALSQSAYAGSGAVPLVQVNPTTNGVTVHKVGSQAIFQLLLGVE